MRTASYATVVAVDDQGTMLSNDARRIIMHRNAYHGDMTKAITVRLDDSDHAELVRQADALRVQPGTLARMLLLGALVPDRGARSEPLEAIGRLVRRSRGLRDADAVDLVTDARDALGVNR